MATKKVTISVPAKLLTASKKRGESFSGYVTGLIAADLARKDMLTYLSELAAKERVTEDDRAWAREQLGRAAKRLRRSG